MSVRTVASRSLVGILAMSMLAVAACSSGGTKPSNNPPQAAGTPKQGGTFSMGIISSPITWPLVTRVNLSDVMVQKLLFDGLVRYSEKDLSPQPALAEKWTTSADGKTWTFNLRKGVKWHDGQPFSSKDVKFTMDLVLNPEVGGTSHAYYKSILSEVTTPDANTVEFKLKEAVPGLLVQLGYNFPMVPEHLLSKLPIATLKEPKDFMNAPVGTGAFKFKENVSGDHMTVLKNPEYWDGAPNVDSILLKVVPDSNAQVAQLLANQLDFTEIAPPVMPTLQGKPNVVIDQSPQVNYLYFALNQSVPLFQDKKVRQAMMYAMDRDTMIKSAVNGTAEIALHPISPVLKGFNKNVPTYAYDPAKAKALLKEAGWTPGPDGILVKDGKKFSFELLVDKGNVSREQTALFATKNWKDVGIDAKYQFGEFATVVDRYRKGEYEARITYWITPPTEDHYNYWHSKGSSNFSKYKNAEIDQQFEKGRTATDPAQSKQYYDKAQELLAEEVPALWLYYPKEVRALSSRTKNFPAVGYRDAMPYLHKLWLDK